MGCIIQAKTNGENSILHEKLLSIVEDEVLAEELWSYFYTDEAVKIFGDFDTNWKNDLADKNITKRTDDNGEPLLKLNKAINKHYFLDEFNEPVYYPYGATGLQEVFDSEGIRQFANILALNFYKENINFDFDNLVFSNDSTKLKEFIEDFIGKKVTDLLSQPDEVMITNAMSLEATSSDKYIDEWVKEVKAFFQGLQISYKEYDEVQEEYDEESDSIIQSIVRKESWTKSSRDSINNNIKLRLSLTTSNKLNGFNEYNFISFDDIASTLNRSLSGKVAILDANSNLEDIYQLYVDEIEKISTIKPHFKGLLPKNPSELFKNQFVSAFYLVKNNFLGSEASRDEEGNLSYIVRNLAEVSSKKNNILEQWFFNFADSNAFNNISYIRQEANKGKLLLDGDFRNIKTEFDLLPHLTNVKKALDSLGVEHTMKGFDFFLNGLDYEQSSIDKKKQRLLDVFNRIDRITSKLKEGEIKNELNIFIDQNLFKLMAEAEAFFLEEGKDVSFFSAGKSKWAYSNPSYLDLKISVWKKNPNLLYKHYLQSKAYNKGSHYMHYLTAIDISSDITSEERLAESKKRIGKMELNIFNSVQQEGDSKNASDSKELSYTDSVVDYLNKLLGYKKGAKVYHKTALAADKSTVREIYYGNDTQYFNMQTNPQLENGKAKVNDAVEEVFYNYFKSDYERMYEAYEEVNGENVDKTKLIPNYHLGNKNAFKSQLFPSLSLQFKNGKVILPETGFDLYNKDGKPLYKNLDEVKVQVKEQIGKFISDGILDTYSLLLDEGIFTYDKKGKRINIGVDSNIYNKYAHREGSPIALQIASDMYVNSVMSQVEYSKMFSGDVAYYKHIVDYRKRGPAPYTDGRYLRITPGNEYFNIGVMETVKISPVLMQQMKKDLPEEIWKAYENNVDVNDAQAWITPTRWKFLMDALGKTSPTLESAYQKLLKPNPEFTKEESKLLAQPLKGVYFNIDNGIPIYLKYSQAVLLPNLTKGTPLQKIYDKMVEEGLDEVLDNSAIKVGYPIPTKTHDAKGNIIDDFTFTKVRLENAYWKLQQDLPTKGVKLTDVGSQLRDNVFLGLAYNRDKVFDVDESTMTGEKLIEYINGITGTMSQKGVDRITTKLGLDDEFKITNERVLYSLIIKQLKKRNDIPNNYINALHAGLSPYAVPGLLPIFQNVFSKLINNATIKTQTEGGGFIQMSDYGLTKSEAEESGILFTPWFKSSKLHTPKVVHNKKTGRDEVTPGGVFISGSYISKYVPDYKKYTPEQLFGTLDKNSGKYINGLIDEKILRNIIGYRIPNQGLPSSDALQVMGILPEEVADTVVAYVGITTKTGSDYDIDKMYLMLPSIIPKYSKEYKNSINNYINSVGLDFEAIKEELEEAGYDVTDMTKKMAYDLFTDDILLSGREADNYYYIDFHSNYYATSLTKRQKDGGDVIKLMYASPSKDKDGNERPLHEQSDETLRNKLIEAYKAVFTNPHNLAQIMKPVEVPYIEADIINLNQEEEVRDLEDFNAISNLKTKHEFKTAKAGLGQGINSLADTGRGSMASQYLEYQMPYSQDEITTLDGQDSFSLTKQEIKDYVASFNAMKADNKDEVTIEDITKLAIVPISDSFMALANAYVDVANNPFIVKGNWNTQTNPIGFMLLRTGMHPFMVNAFLGQPIIKEYVLFKDNKESKIIDDTSDVDVNFKLKKAADLISQDESITINGKTVKMGQLFRTVFTPKEVRLVEKNEAKDYGDRLQRFKTAIGSNIRERFDISVNDIVRDKDLNKSITDLTNKLVDIYNNMFEQELKSFEQFTLKDLRDELIETDVVNQASLLNIFLDWQDVAKDVTNGVNASKITVNGKGKNISSLLVSKNLIVNLLEEKSKLKDFKSKLTFNGKDTFLKTALKNGITFPHNIMKNNPKYFFTASNSVFSTFNTVSRFISDENLINMKLGDKLEKSYYSYIMSGLPAISLNRKERQNLLNTLPGELAELKKDKNINNAIINELYNKRSQEDGKFFISSPNIKNTVTHKNKLTDAFRDLMETHPEFTNKLIQYSFLISGFNNSMNQFHEFIPYEWFNRNRVNSYLKSLELNDLLVDRVFINQFFRHKTEDTAIVKHIFGNQMEMLKDKDNYYSGYILKDTNQFAPYLTKLETKEQGDFFYKLEGRNTSGKAVYTRTTPLGYSDNKGNKGFEYNLNASTVSKPLPSSFKKNILMDARVNSELLRDIRTRFDIYSEVNRDAIEKDSNIVEIRPIESVQENFFNEAVAKGQVKKYSKVNKTKNWGELKDRAVFTEEGINTMRTSNKEKEYMHFGNPFSASDLSGTIKKSSIQEAVDSYKEWLNETNYQEVNPEQRTWILEQIQNEELKNKTLFYMNKKIDGKFYESHADILKSFINNKMSIDKNQLQLFDPFKC